MYKNFNLTESEKEQILNLHKQKGYGKSLNEQQSEEVPSGNETTKIGTGWNRKESDDEDKQIQLAKEAIWNSIDSTETYHEPTDFTYMVAAMEAAMSGKYSFTPYILANALSDLIDGYNQKQNEPDSDMEFARANRDRMGELGEDDSKGEYISLASDNGGMDMEIRYGSKVRPFLYIILDDMEKIRNIKKINTSYASIADHYQEQSHKKCKVSEGKGLIQITDNSENEVYFFKCTDVYVDIIKHADLCKAIERAFESGNNERLEILYHKIPQIYKS